VELLANQSQGVLDNTSIRDHRIVFTDTSQHPGDSGPDVFRLRRVIAVYDCAADIDQTTDLQTLFTDTVRPHMVALFETEFSPNIFAVEDRRVSYDETAKRVSAQMTFLYQADGGSGVVEITTSVAFRESRNIDYTFLHDRGELSANADPGFAVVERVSNRTAVVIGAISPKRRLGGSVKSSGWNIVASTSQSTPKFIGDPTVEEQIQLTILTETVVERMTSGGGAGGPKFGTHNPGGAFGPEGPIRGNK
jgi:hypothetical protein